MAKSQRRQASPENTTPYIKTVTVNRKATHDYEVLEAVEAGLALKGTEIKAIREGRVNIQDAFARRQEGELWLFNCHIAPYSAGNLQNHEPTRPRKLLLHWDQIAELTGKAAQKGYTLIPLRLYLKGHLAKVALGLCRGRRQYDKRQVLARREDEREMDRALKARERPT